MSERAYAALVEEAGKVGWPEHYRNDLLVHDRELLTGNGAPAVFGWVLRPCGTHLLRPSRSWDEHEMGLYERSFGPECRYYFWTGQVLQEVSKTVLVRYLREADENPAETKVRRALVAYLGHSLGELEVVPDPGVEGVFAAREGGQNGEHYLVTIPRGDRGDVVEEVRFKSWPPQSVLGVWR